MPSRPDLRELAANVKEAFAEMDRETLLEILTFVVKEYVVEGPPPMLVHQAETLADLKNATFAQVISALQTRFDFPELQMFVVDGERVSVRVGGVVQPLLAGAQAMPAAESPRPAAGVRIVETSVQQQRPPQPPAQFIDTRPNAAPPPPGQPQPERQAPPPRAGLSVRGRPSPEDNPAHAAERVAQQPPAPGAQPAAPAAGQAPTGQGQGQADGKPDTAGGDDASARFSLLELD